MVAGKLLQHEEATGTHETLLQGQRSDERFTGAADSLQLLGHTPMYARLSLAACICAVVRMLASMHAIAALQLSVLSRMCSSHCLPPHGK